LLSARQEIGQRRQLLEAMELTEGLLHNTFIKVLIAACEGLILPSVTIPSVPSAPMNSLVRSKPADDFLALCLVLMTSPEGRTTV